MKNNFSQEDKNMTENIEVLTHSSIRISGKQIIYIDPFQIREEKHDADFILITHDHFDHFSPDDIAKIKKADTTLIIPEKMKNQATDTKCEKIITVNPGMRMDCGGFMIETIASYNENKLFHPKENGWVGYIIKKDGNRIYIAGDTDITDENRSVSCDVAMVPIGGKYTMDAEEAAELVNIIKPKIAIPIHYGSITGSKDDANVFMDKVDQSIAVEIKLL